MARRTLAIACAVACSLLSSSAALAAQPGSVTQLTAPDGCVQAASDLTTCSDALGLENVGSVTVSPDGKNVYATPAAGWSGSLTIFRRNTDGSLDQIDDGCWNNFGVPGCVLARGMDDPTSVVVSPDGLNVYVANYNGSGITEFARDPADGSLTQLADAAGCLRSFGFDSCGDIQQDLNGVIDLAVDKAGKTVYALGFWSHSVVAFDRDPLDGHLIERTQDGFCLDTQGDFGCDVARAIEYPEELTLSPRDDTLYVTSPAYQEIAILSRTTSGPDTGRLTQAADEEGCIRADGSARCEPAPQIGSPRGTVVSPDGEDLYVARHEGLASFERFADGSLRPRAGRDACWTYPYASPLCKRAKGLWGTASLAMSPDGETLYALAGYDNAVVAFDRRRDGILRPVAGHGACDSLSGFTPSIGDYASKGVCEVAERLDPNSTSPGALAVSPDGLTLHAAASESSSIVTLGRAATGGQNAADRMSWDLAEDFPSSATNGDPAPGGTNPTGDRHGNANVWSLREFPGAADASDRTESAYALLPYHAQDDTASRWSAGPFEAPWVELYNGSAASAHPGVDRSTVIGWKSPVTATVNVAGMVNPQSRYAFDGIDWYVDKNGTVQRSGTLEFDPSGSYAEAGFFDFNLPVVAGDDVWLVVAPHGSNANDGTDVDLRVTGPLDGLLQTRFLSGAKTLTNDSTPTFSFASNLGGVNEAFQCRVDTAAFAACGAPGNASTTTAALADGPHTFEVRARDTLANKTDPSPAKRSFTVDTQAPAVTITTGPNGATRSENPEFSFTTPESRARLSCSLDGAAFERCDSPKSYSGLTEAPHTFRVKARDLAGNTGAETVRAFTVSTGPDTLQAGALAQVAGATGCVAETTPLSNGDVCGDGNGLVGLSGVAVYGNQVYGAALNSSTLLIFDRGAHGGLTQRAGEAGCLSRFFVPDCVDDVVGLHGAISVAVSPDGANVYVSGYLEHSIAVFDRAADGSLTPAGCIGGGPGCAPARALVSPGQIEVDPAGEHLYVTAESSASVVVLDRDTADGSLSQPAGVDGCYSDSGTGGECRNGRAMAGASNLALSPDGANLYVGAPSDAAVATFAVQTDGTLRQLPGEDGCIRETAGEDCYDGVSLTSARALDVSPDGQNVYVAVNDGVAVLDRDETGALGQDTESEDACVSVWWSVQCRQGRAADAEGMELAVAPDGRTLYVVDPWSEAISIFERDADGDLRQLSGQDACWSSSGNVAGQIGSCRDGRGLGSWFHNEIAFDASGANLYATGLDEGTITAFRRNLPRSASEPQRREWDVLEDFDRTGAANHTGDRYGNADVWAYLKAPAALDGSDRDPATYEDLDQFDTNRADRSHGWFDSAGSAWLGAGPAYFARDRFLVHPEDATLGGESMVTRWRNPLPGTSAFDVSLLLEDSVGCGDGVNWYLDRNATPLESGVLAAGGRGQQKDLELSLAFHDELFFVISPLAAYDCDQAFLDLHIEGTREPGPQTTITGGPRVRTSDDTPAWTFASDEPGTFECSMDGGAFAACASAAPRPVVSPDGEHTFRVRAKNGAAVDGTPARRRFVLDTLAPTIAFESGPTGSTNDTSPEFTFTASEPGVRECRLDGGAWAACASPFRPSELADGEHVLEIRARDRARNLGAQKTRTFKVVTGAGSLQPGALAQLNGDHGCVSRWSPLASTGTCTLNASIDDPASGAFDSTGTYLYVVSRQSNHLTVLRRTPAGQPNAGRLTPLTGEGFCFTATAVSGVCSGTLGMEDPYGVAVSGDNVYVTSNEDSTVAIFQRNPDGSLAQLPEEQGCLSWNGATDGCRSVRGLAGPTWIELAPSGESAYVAATASSAVTVLRRDTESGTLIQPAGTAGCVQDSGQEGCADGRALHGPIAIAVAPDEANVYVASWHAAAVSSFARAADGSLTQIARDAGCIRHQSTAEGCAAGRLIGNPRSLAISPDGHDVYTASETLSGFATLHREADGGLSQRDGSDGCGELNASVGCADTTATDSPTGVVVAPDGENVYFTSRGTGLSSFARDGNGVLRQLSGRDACYTNNGGAPNEGAGVCREGKGLHDGSEGGNGLVISPDGEHVYALSEVDDAIAALARRRPPAADQPGDMVWDARADFVRDAPGANPVPNRFGSGNAWSYKFGPAGDGDATVRNPATYTAMPQFTAPFWYSSVADEAPHWGILAGRLATHPGPPPDLRAGVLQWTNSTGAAREFNVSGLVQDQDPSCGEGIRFYLDHGATALASGLLLNGDPALSFDVNEVVAAGESLYLTVAPRAGWDCDRTFVDLVVTGGPQPGPQTEITAGPRTTTADSTPAFQFAGGPAFQCRVDGGAFAPCASGDSVASLPDGAHRFEVRSKDGPAVDPTPAARRFRVDTTAPTTTIEAGPDGLTRDRTPTYDIGIEPAEQGTLIQCRVDSSLVAAWQACDSPYTLPELSNGPHTFDVRGVDRWGNAEASKRIELQVDTSPAGLQFGGLTQLAGTAGCISDTGDGGACADGRALAGLDDVVVSPDGTHVYATATDADAVLTFSRTPSGVLTQLAGAQGCVSATGADACGTARALVRPETVAVSPDGHNLYVGSANSHAVAIFAITPDGTLTQPPGAGGCVRLQSTDEGCGSVRVLDPYNLAVAPDGAQVYAVNQGDSSISVLDRDPLTGALSMRAGAAGCLRHESTADTCTSARHLAGPAGIAFAGSHVYISSLSSSAIGVYQRAPGGALNQLAGTDGCLRWNGTTAAGCAQARRIATPQDLAASPDGKSLYAAGQFEGAIAVLNRNTTTGVLTQSPSAAGCWEENGSGLDGGCEEARLGFDVSSLALAPDGKTLYALSPAADLLSIFRRSTQNGTLQQLSGVDGCWSLDGSSPDGPSTCRDGKALGFGGAQALAVSPDSANVYAPAPDADALTAFARRVPRPDNLPAIPEWNLAEDFDVNVAATLPSADRYGNTGVWDYLRGNGGTDGAGRDRAGYVRLDAAPAPTGFRKLWRSGDVSVGLGNARRAYVHPAPDAPAVVRWTYPGTEPTTGEVSLQVTDADPSGGDGIRWFLDRNGTQAGTGRLRNGGRPQQLDRTVVLNPGDVLELLVYPTGGFDFDLTRVDLQVTSAPVIDTAFTAESPNGLTNDTTPTFTATSAEAGATFQCRHFAVGATPPLFTPCAQPFTIGPLADGSWRVEARSVVGASVDQTPAFRIVKVDATAPAVTVTAPANGSATNDTTPTFSGAAGNEVEDADAGDDLEPVTVKVWEGTSTSGQAFRTLNTTRGGTNAWTVTLPGADLLPQGTYTVKAFQDDEAGNQGSSPASTFKVDTVAPVVAITSPPAATPFSATNNPTPVISGTAGSEDGSHPLRSVDGATVRIRIWAGTSSTGTPVRDYTTARAVGAFSGAAPAPGLPEGTYTARADQDDAAGNTGSSVARTFKIDTTPPAITLNLPPAPDETRDRTPAFTGIGGASTGNTDPREAKDDDLLTVRIYAGTTATGTPLQSMTTTHDALGAYTVDAASDLPDGTYTTRTSQGDAAGNTGNSNTRTFEVDRTVPVLSVTAPPADTNDNTPAVSGIAGTLSGSAADSVADKPQVEVRIFAGTTASGSPLEFVSTTRNAVTGAYSATVLNPLADGTYTALVEQEDVLANHAAVTRTFKVDTVNPVGLDVDEPVQDLDTQGTPHFAGSAATEDGTHPQRSADAALVTVRIHQGTDTSGAVVRTLTLTRSGGSWSGDLPPAEALTTGRYAVQATQQDAAGNVTASNVRRFRVDVTPPVVTLTTPAQNLDTNDTTPLLAGTAGTADGSGLPAPELAPVRVRIFAGTSTAGVLVDTLNTTRDAATGAWQVSPATALAEGTYTAQADQLDNAGNRGFSNARTFKVDITAPAPTVAPEGDTNDSTPNLSGTAGTEDGSHVARSADGATVTVEVWSGTDTSGAPARTLTTTRSGGAWDVDVTPALADGTWTAVSSQSDAAGNTGRSAPRTFKVDTVAPAVALTAPAAGADLDDDTPTVAGTAGTEDGTHVARSADAGSVTVKVWSGTSTSGTPLRTLSVARTGGTFSTDLAHLDDGTYTVRAEQADGAGNLGASLARTFKVDTVDPAVTVTTPAAGLDTDDDTPAVSGTAGNEDGTHPARSADAATVTVRVYSGATATGSPLRTLTVPRTAATWSDSVTPALADGTYTVQATQTDAAGNTGTSNARTFKVDTVDPAPTLDPEPDTNDSTPTLSGTAGSEDGSHPARSADSATVTVKVWSGTDTSGTAARTLTATRTGSSWSADVTPALDEGTWTARAEQADGAGNTGTSGTRTFKVDTTAPVLSVAPEGDTNDTTPNLSGTAGAEDGSHPARTADAATVTVRVWSGTSTSGPADRTLTVPRSGTTWNADVTPALPEGTWTARASQGDGAGNTGTSPAMTFKVDITAPAPTVDPEPDTNDTTPNLSGTAGAEDGSHPARSADAGTLTVKVWSGTGTSGPADRTLSVPRSGGTWAADVTPALPEGTWTARAEQSDGAGNTGTSNTRTFKVDTTAPAPTIAAEGETNDSTPNLSGTAGSEDGSHAARVADAGTLTLKLWSGTTAAGPAARTLTVTRTGGTWAADVIPSLPDGTWTGTVSQDDAVGNSGSSAAMTFKVDTVAPAPTVSSPPVLTGDDTPLLAGAAGVNDGSAADQSADATSVSVKLWAGSAATGTPLLDVVRPVVAGGWSQQLVDQLDDGTYTVRVRQTDGAGNAGEDTRTFKIDTVAPTVTLDPEPDTNDSTPTLSGSAGDETGSHPARAADSTTVTVKVWSGTDTSGPAARTLTATRTGSSWSIDVTPALSEGTWTARASQDDAAANTGTSGTRTFKLDTTAPSPAIASEGDTNDSTPNLSGTAGTEDGSHAARTADAGTVTVKVWSGTSTAGTAARTLTAPRTAGTWNADVTPSLADGTWTAIVSQDDGAGNTGSSPAMTFKVDTAAPAPTLDPEPDTNDTTPNLSGTAGNEDGGHAARSADAGTVTVKVWSGTGTSGTADRTLSVARSGGSWNADVTPALAEGTWTARVEQGDAAGNTGTSSIRTFKVDTTAPAPTLEPEADTADGTPTLSGTAGTEDGSHAARTADAGTVTVKVWSGTTATGAAARTLTATRTGSSWSADVTPVLADGTWTARAEQADGAANTGSSTTRTFKVDTTAPAVTLDAVANPDDESRPTFAGTAGTEIGTHVARVADAGTATVKVWSGTSTAGAPARTLSATVTGGAYSIRVPAGQELADGTWTARGEQDDAVANTGLSPTRTFKVDTADPAPTLDAEPDTNDTTPNLSGTAGSEDGGHAARSADAGTVTVSVWPGTDTSAAPARTLTVARSGASWNADVTAALTEGTWTARAEQSDAAGNSGSSATRTFKVDTTAPAPTLTQPGAGSVSSDTTPAFVGTAGTEDGTHAARTADAATVALKVYAGPAATGAPVRTLNATRAAGGAWAVTLQLASALPDGVYTARAEQADGAGNTGASNTRTFEVDSIAPAVAITAPADGAETNDNTPTVAGTGGTASLAPDAAIVTVKVYAGPAATGTPVRTLAAPRAGSGWSVDVIPALDDGTYTVAATQADGAANLGVATRTFRVDTAAPAVTVTAPVDGAVTEDTTPALGGAAGDAAGDAGTVQVKLWQGAGAVGSPVHQLDVTRSGAAWSADAPALAVGTWTLVASQEDRAGNRSAATRTFTVKSVEGGGGGDPPPPPPPPADTTPPTLQLARLPIAARLSASVFGTGSLNVTVTANENAAALGELLLPLATAKRLGLKLTATTAGARVVADASATGKYVILAKAQAQLVAGRPGMLALKLSRSTRAKLAKAPKLALLLRVTALDAAGNKVVTRKPFSVKRPRRR